MTVNSDDPPLFGTTLNDEFAKVGAGFGFSVDQLDEILLNGVRHSFLPPDEKELLLDEFRAELAVLRAEHRPEVT